MNMYHCPYCDEWLDYHLHHRPCPTLVARLHSFRKLGTVADLESVIASHADLVEGAVGGHIPSEPDESMRPPTAQEVNLMQHENIQLKERVAELESLNGFIQAQKVAEFLDLRVGSQLVESARDKIEKLNKVHFAACRHLEAMGACDDTGDHDDESHAEVFGCTYCNLDRAASAVEEKP